MAVFTEPEKFSVLPGSAADTGKIQSGGSTLNPSLVNLFPAIYQLALAAGGKAPERTTFNEFLRLILQRLYYIERGGMWSYDATADYPAGAVVGHSGSLYLALKDNGSGTDAGAVSPDADGEVWQKLETAADLTKVLLGYLPVAAAEADYLKKTDAADTYLSKTDASADYLKKSDAADTYLSKNDASADYLKKSDAADTYLSKSDASDTYQTKADLSSQITATVKSGWYTNFPDGAEAHNAMWGGRDITAAFNAGTVSEHIADGTFKDIFPGDYITKQVTISGTAYTIKFIVAHLDIWLHRGDTSCETHHVAIVPETPPYNAYMNSTNTTAGGYVGSYMNKTVMPAFATGLQNAFGASHLISFRWWEDTTVNTNVPSAGYAGWTGALLGNASWNSYICHLMQEGMVYGQKVWASSGCDECMCGQFAAFRLNSNLVYNRQTYWLSDVVSSARFALVFGYGAAIANSASGVFGVRPFALLV